MTCPQLSPCDLLTAVNSTANGDEVIVLTGTYNLATNSADELGETAGQNVVIHGESPAAPPLLKIAPTNVARGFVADNTVTVRDLRISYEGINASSTALEANFFSTVERVHVDAGAHGNVACVVDDSVTLTNTACLARDTSSPALEFWYSTNIPSSPDYAATVRNSTFVATGVSGYGVRVVAGNGHVTGTASVAVRAFNSIFSATGTGSNDVAVQTLAADDTAEFDAQNSNFSSVTVTGLGANNVTATAVGGNQPAAPLLTDPAAGDLTQLAGSPTIDAGADDPANGTLDLAAQPRTAGTRTDIGAYEVQPPVAPQPEYALSAASFSPKSFRAAAKGATLRAPSARPKTKRGQKPIGSILKFSSTDAGDVDAYAYRALKGRKGKSGKCGRPSRANARGKRCTYHKRLRGSATAAIAAGENRFYFTGRWGGKKLAPGSYVIVLKHKLKGSSIPSSTGNEAGTAKGIVKITR